MTPIRVQSALSSSVPSKQPPLELLKSKPLAASVTPLRLAFWSVGILLASAQAWIFRYEVSADSISYFDMSDAVLRGGRWHQLINGMYSLMYPSLLGVFRRTFNISAGNEIPAAHLLGVLFFIFAFACYEFLLAGIVRKLELPGEDRSSVPLPKWAFLSVAYSIFLWSAIVHISLEVPRTDMLLSGFFFLVAGLVLRMHGRPASWRSYLLLGVILGLGILAKDVMLMIGFFALACTLLAVEDWRPALKMAAGALAVMFLIGAVYFVPLSLQRGRLTLGDAGKDVYITNVDEASPHWYLQSTGSAKGSFLHPPQRIFVDPPAYAFAIPQIVTHPLRYDPSYWIAGVSPHFVLGREVAAVKLNVHTLARLFRELRAVIATIFVLAFLCGSRKQVTSALFRAWPVWLIGLAGCALYTAIYIEPRYVTAFLTLFFVGMLAGFPVPAETGRKVAQLVVLATIALLLYPVAARVYRANAPRTNVSLEAAQALQKLGIRSGDPVARISSSAADMTVERILRVEIVAEVDRDHAAAFWSAPLATQQSLLKEFAAKGVRAVIATSPVFNSENQPEWSRLGSTQYWVWRPAGLQPAHRFIRPIGFP